MTRQPIAQRTTAQALAGLAGAGAYALSIYLTAILNIPGSDNVQLRPGVVVPIVCGALFGPAAGFASGFVGNLIADQMLGWGFWPFWYLGNGMMGLAAGLFRPTHASFARLQPVLRVLGRAIAGIAVGMGIASVSELWVTQSSWQEVVSVNFLPAFLSNTINAAVLTPITLLVYGILRESTAINPPSSAE